MSPAELFRALADKIDQILSASGSSCPDAVSFHQPNDTILTPNEDDEQDNGEVSVNPLVTQTEKSSSCGCQASNDYDLVKLKHMAGLT